jgi:hypothetical protein
MSAHSARDLPDHDAATMDAVFSRPMPDWTDRSAVATFAADGAELLGNDPEQARATAARIWDRTPSSEPSVQQANQLGMVFARLDCAPRWRQRLGELTLPTLVVHGRADPFFPVGNGETLAGAIPAARLLVLDDMGTPCGTPRPARSPPQCSPSDSAAGPAAAAGTLRLADLDVGNGRFRRWAMHPQPSDRPRRRSRP